MATTDTTEEAIATRERIKALYDVRLREKVSAPEEKREEVER